MASLARGGAEDLEIPGVPLTADASDNDLELGTETVPQEPQTANPTRTNGKPVSRLLALIADTALQEVNPCRAMDVAVFLDSECMSIVGRRMREANQDTFPILGPHSLESDGLSPHMAQNAKRTRELLHLVYFDLGVPTLSLSS